MSPAQIAYNTQRDAAFGGRVFRRRDMDEYGASQARLRRVVIVANGDDDIVEIVLAPQHFMRRVKGQLDEPIIVAVSRFVAPSVIAGQRAHRQPARRRR